MDSNADDTIEEVKAKKLRVLKTIFKNSELVFEVKDISHKKSYWDKCGRRFSCSCIYFLKFVILGPFHLTVLAYRQLEQI